MKRKGTWREGSILGDLIRWFITESYGPINCIFFWILGRLSTQYDFEEIKERQSEECMLQVKGNEKVRNLLISVTMARPESRNRSLRVCDPAYKYFIPTYMKDKTMISLELGWTVDEFSH